MKDTSRTMLLLACVVTLALTATACLNKQTMGGDQAAGDVDRKLSRFAFIEDGRLAAFIVSTQATLFRDKASYMPIEIAIANRSLPELAIVLESFTLIDEEGNRYPAAQPSELIDDYPHLDQDRQRYSELFSLISTRFSAFNQLPSKLSPTRSGRPVQDLTSLPKFGVVIDFIYFPMPSTGVRGKRFELFLDTPELEDPLFVKFTVP